MLSNEFNIVVCTSVFLQKKIFFVNFAFFLFLEISHAWRGRLEFNIIFWEVQTKPFRNIRSFLFTSHFGGPTSRTSNLGHLFVEF